jgi:hypothetical protein
MVLSNRRNVLFRLFITSALKRSDAFFSSTCQNEGGGGGHVSVRSTETVHRKT